MNEYSAWGFDPDAFRLDHACADFYLLEYLTSKGGVSPRVRTFASEYEETLARHISGYFEYAVTTELYYLPYHGLEGPPMEDCCECHPDYGDCADCCICECSTDYCGGYGSCNDCTCECDLGSGVWETVKPYLSPEAYKFGQALEHDHDAVTSGWRQYVEEHGRVAMLDAASQLFTQLPWESGYGGDGWGLIAAVTRDYHAKNIKRRTFLDRAWTMKHNGGVAFDKAQWHGEGNLYALLEAQAHGKYGVLAANSTRLVKALWYIDQDGSSHRTGRDPAWLGRASDVSTWRELLEERGIL